MAPQPVIHECMDLEVGRMLWLVQHLGDLYVDCQGSLTGLMVQTPVSRVNCNVHSVQRLPLYLRTLFTPYEYIQNYGVDIESMHVNLQLARLVVRAQMSYLRFHGVLNLHWYSILT